MKMQFIGNTDGLLKGIKIICELLEIEIGAGDYIVEVEQGSGLSIILDEKKARIVYGEKCCLFRALGLLYEEIKKGNTRANINETMHFKYLGSMLDVCQNAALSVDSIKKMLCYHAVMGFNNVWFYPEDKFEMDGHPWFGYLRGIYTQKELREIDDYAYDLGIEIVPCIQTLGHLHHVMNLDAYQNIKDTNTSLYVGKEETYDFIEAMIKTMKSCFRSKRIQLGMDEVPLMCLGKYYKDNGCPADRLAVLNEHAARVKEIANCYGYEDTMIWSDTYFRLSDPNNSYISETRVPREVVEKIPKGLTMVAWDYYHTDYEFYDMFLRKNIELGQPVVFAGGIWTWFGMCLKHRYTVETTNPALAVCKDLGIQEINATLWLDDGAEVSLFTGLLGLQLYAEHCYTDGMPDMKRVEERFFYCTGEHAENFKALAAPDELPVDQVLSGKEDPTKWLLYQDIMCGKMDRNVLRYDLTPMFENARQLVEKGIYESKNFSYVFRHLEVLCRALKIKWNIGIRIKLAYENDDKETLKAIIDELPVLYELVSETKDLHRDMYYRENKPFGFDLIDRRYGSVLTAIQTAEYRLKAYINGEIEKLEEVECERFMVECYGEEIIEYPVFRDIITTIV